LLLLLLLPLSLPSCVLLAQSMLQQLCAAEYQ
jgi:hypothetical protein